jgi:anti-sigma regulatory factor (Ser/Thr protein kinase)
VREVDGVAVLELHGELNRQSAARVREPLRKLLLDRGQVVADVAGLHAGWRPAVQVFPTTVAEAGGWPLARLVLLGPDPELTDALRAVRADKTVPLASAWEVAMALVGQRPPHLSRRVELPLAVEAPALARAAVADMCLDWELPALAAVAAIVASELVTNAVEHARTTSTLVFTATPRGLFITVTDRDSLSGTWPRRPHHREGRHWGLALVEGLCRHWGVSPHQDGKSVWAVLDLKAW